MHGSSRGSSNHLQCSVAVFTVMFFVSILMVLMLLDCAVQAHKHCTDFTQPSLLFALSYCDFEKTCTKCAIISQEFVIFKCVREERVSCVLCGEERMRCGFLFLWLTLLSDALDINIIAHQWPTQKSHPSLHISIRPADLSECTVLSLTTGDRLVCSCSPVNKNYTTSSLRDTRLEGLKANVHLVYLDLQDIIYLKLTTFECAWDCFFSLSNFW